jgi:predicted dienelactone hydrolase
MHAKRQKGSNRQPSKRRLNRGTILALRQQGPAALKLPVLLINLGGDERWKAFDVTERGSNLVGKLPDMHYAAVEPGHHFTFLAECKPDGRRLLAEEHDDPVCDDPAGTDRAHAHAEIIERIAAFLRL